MAKLEIDKTLIIPRKDGTFIIDVCFTDGSVIPVFCADHPDTQPIQEYVKEWATQARARQIVKDEGITDNELQMARFWDLVEGHDFTYPWQRRVDPGINPSFIEGLISK